MENTTKEIVKTVEGKVKNAVRAVEDIKIKTDEDQQKAALILTNVKKLSKWLTSEKEKILKPLREATNATRGMFAPFEDDIDRAEGKLKSALADYKDKKDREQATKEASIVARAEKGQLKEETAVRKLEELGTVKTNVKTGEGTITYKKEKKVRVTDESLVPDQYWTLNMVAVRRDVLAGMVVAGTEMYEETNVAANV